MSGSKKRLGKGLDSLIGGEETEEEDAERGPSGTDTDDRDGPNFQYISVDRIRPNPYQPRSDVDQESLEPLVESIRQDGVLQPVLVTPDPEGQDDAYLLAAGERRWRATRKAGRDDIPAVVRSLDDRNLLAVALVENIQREDLNPIEQARALEELYSEFDMTLEEVAEETGLSTSAVSNLRRLLKLSEPLQDAVADGDLSGSHARALLSLKDPARRESLAHDIIQKNLSVRETEERVRHMKQSPSEKASSNDSSSDDDDLPPVLKKIQDRLEARVGSRVRITERKEGGEIKIRYASDDDLEGILERIGIDSIH